ncbi:MAG: DUF2141 domain-containing protein [Acidobacteriota bacterium]
MNKGPLSLATALLLTSGTAILAEPTGSAPLTIELDGLRNGHGAVVVAAYDQARAFEEMDFTSTVAMAYLPAAVGKVAVTLHNLPPGNYAVAAIHDEDGDGDLAMDGDVPTEGYAFAAMGPGGLPPKFEDAAVAAGADATVKLRLRYWN